MDVEINDLAQFGINLDIEGYQLPPEAFTFAENMRVGNGGIERNQGWGQEFGTPGVAPHFVLPINSATQAYWLYTSLTKAYVFDGTDHTNITRQSGMADDDYNTTATRQWNGTLLGGVPILNNGVDEPQFWAALDPSGTDLADLTNWTTGDSARVIRAFGSYLIALDPTLSSTRYPHMVKWSHPADPGSIPSSWDETDATVDAGQVDLPDVSAGIIVDGMPLRGRFYVYKEGSVWRMSSIGGQYVFDFDTFLETTGLLASRCVAITGDGLRHVMVSQDDMLVHDGNSAQSVLDRRFKKTLFNAIDTSNFRNSFCFTNPLQNEVWFCYPESDETQPTRALIWNYREGGITESEVDFRNAASGTIEIASPETWASITETWGSVAGPWSVSNRRQVILCNTDSTEFHQLDGSTLRNGSAFTGTLQRVGLALAGRKRNGEWIVDYHSRKQVNRVWIKASGGPINVRLGFQELVDGPVTWSDVVSFDPTIENYVDIAGSGLAVSVEFQAAVPFRIVGYKPEGEIISEF